MVNFKMIPMLKFSVLMSLYDKELPEYFELCLNSLYKQTLPANEIILVLDGKINKELMAIINKWKEILPITTVQIENNVGLGNALNIGIKHCSNSWVARMDTDDICVHDRFEKQIKHLVDNPEVKLLGGRIDEFYENPDVVISTRFSCSKHNAIFEYCRSRNPFNHMTVMFNRNVVIEQGGYCHHLYMEDYNLWLRILSSGYKVANIDDVLVKVRVGNGMLQRRRGWKYVKSELILAKLKRNLKIDSNIRIMTITFLRIIPRLIPQWGLECCYKILRKK